MRVATIGSGLGPKGSRSASALLAGAVLVSACTASDGVIDEPSAATPDAVSTTDVTATTDSGPAPTDPLDTVGVETAPPATDASGPETPPSADSEDESSPAAPSPSVTEGPVGRPTWSPNRLSW